jgi:hypothetical protein
MTSRTNFRVPSSIPVDKRISGEPGRAYLQTMTSRGLESVRRMILHMADLLETEPNIMLSGRFACQSVVMPLANRQRFLYAT